MINFILFNLYTLIFLVFENKTFKKKILIFHINIKYLINNFIKILNI